MAQSLVKLVKEGKSSRFWLEDGLLFTKGNCMFVPRADGLRRMLMRECHDTLWADHPGWQRTHALLKQGYYWPQMRDDVMEYTRTCLTCQQDKVERVKTSGLLEPLSIPTRPWESVSLDFITNLPKVGDFSGILVVVDRFSKYATFVPTTKYLSAEDTASLFFKHVVKYWGVPQNIVSDRDVWFTGSFWSELFKLLGSELNLSSSYHPQTDGQTERFNAMLEEYLRHFVSANQKNWTGLLDIAQFCFNSKKSSATNKSPFEIVTGQQPLLPHTVQETYRGKHPKAFNFTKEWKNNAEIARAYLEKAAERMKKWADHGRKQREFQVGDMVLVKLNPEQFRYMRNRDKRLARRYEGPLPILAKVGKCSYKVDIPAWMRTHPVFHVSNLKPHQQDEEDPACNQPARAVVDFRPHKPKVVEKILAERTIGRSRTECRHQYLVKWKNLGAEETS